MRAAVVCAVLALVAVAPCLAAQSDVENNYDVVIHHVDVSRFPNLSVWFSAIEGRKALTDLQPSEVSVAESGQEIEDFDLRPAGAETEMAFILLLDTSESMEGGRMRDAKEALLSFINELRPPNKAAVLVFDESIRVVSDFSGDKETLKGAVGKIGAGKKKTRLYDAVHDAVERCAAFPSLRATVVVFTDGDDTASTYDENQCVEHAKRMGVPLYTVCATKDKSLNQSLERMAKDTGGRHLAARKYEELPQLYGDIAALLQGQYMIVYRAVNLASFEQERRLSLGVARGGHTARAVSLFKVDPDALARHIRELYEKGLDLFGKRKYEAALALFNEVLDLDPTHKEAADHAGRCREKLEEMARRYDEAKDLFDAKEYEAALEIFLELKSLDEDYKDVTAKAEETREQIRKADEAHSKVVTAQELYNSEELESAARLCEDALQLCPGSAEATSLRDMVQKDADLKASLERSEDEAAAALGARDYDRCLAVCETILAAEKGNPRGRKFIGDCHERAARLAASANEANGRIKSGLDALQVALDQEDSETVLEKGVLLGDLLAEDDERVARVVEAVSKAGAWRARSIEATDRLRGSTFPGLLEVKEPKPIGKFAVDNFDKDRRYYGGKDTNYEYTFRLLIEGPDHSSVSRLDYGDFTVTLDGKELPRFDLLPELGSGPGISLVVVLDTSGSIPEDKRDAVVGAAREAVNRTIDRYDEVALVTFDEGKPIRAVRGKAQCLDLLDDLRWGGPSPLLDAVSVALLLAARGQGIPVVLVLSDGQENASRVEVSGFAAQLNEKAIPIYVLPVGQEPNEPIEAALAAKSAGKLVGGFERPQITAFMQDVAKALETRYAIRVTAPPERSMKSRALDITLDYAGSRAELPAPVTILYKDTHPDERDPWERALRTASFLALCLGGGAFLAVLALMAIGAGRAIAFRRAAYVLAVGAAVGLLCGVIAHYFGGVGL
jgi:VWFA-related protein